MLIRRWSLITPLVALLFGCAPAINRPSGLDRAAVAVVPPPRPVQVITDPGELHTARKLAEERQGETQREELETLLLLADGNRSSFERLRQRQAEVLPLLRQRLENREPSARWARAQAAFLLLRLGDPVGTAAARQLLTEPAAVEVLSQVRALTPADRAKLPGVEPWVLGHLASKDEKIRIQAVTAAVSLGSPEVDRTLIQMIRDGQDPRGQGAFDLARRAPSRQLLDACTAALRKARPGDRYWWLSAVAEHARSRSPELAGAAIETCAEYLGKSAGMTGIDGGAMAALEALERTPGTRATTLLTELTRSRGASELVREEALRSLARQNPGAGRKLALGSLSVRVLSKAAVDALGEAGRGSADPELVDAVAAAASGNKELASPASRALLSIGGVRARKAAVAFLDQVSPVERTALRWAEHEITPQQALERLVALKLLDPHQANAARKQLVPAAARGKADPAQPDGVEQVSMGSESAALPLDGASFVTAAFEAAGLLTSFDTETGELPVRHDKLIRQLAEHSGGAFKPEATHERWEQKSEEDEDAPYTVQFIHSGRLYRFTARNLGDWYDVAAVLAAANQALADAGAPRRFITLEGDGQIANIAFADPSVYARAARELFLPANADPDTARREGKAFENQVVDQIRKGK